MHSERVDCGGGACVVGGRVGRSDKPSEAMS